jgi:hypothetical protein
MMPVFAEGRALEAGIIDPGYRSGVRIFISQAGKSSEFLHLRVLSAR